MTMFAVEEINSDGDTVDVWTFNDITPAREMFDTVRRRGAYVVLRNAESDVTLDEFWG